ncbi:MAG TPA: hypothetical protein VMF03_11900 [Steroidobacteraceae bacterium]|nr:hypothetical protein [Steroidobacteraceae bacterium]
MTRTFRRAAPMLALALASGALAAQPVSHPEMTGTWDRYTTQTLDPRVTAVAPVPPPPLKPRYLAQWQAQQQAAKEADARGEPLYGGYAKCLPDGMPAMMMAMFPMEVLQTPGQITIIEEAYNQVRRIYLNEKQLAIDDAEPGFWGHSVGHWENGTLVVNTVGIKEEVQFRGVPHSPAMQINERMRMLTKDIFEDQVTVTDPQYLTGPWQFTWKYVRKPGYKILEYVCEANREYQDPQTGGIRMRIGTPPGTSSAPTPAPAATPKP